MTKKYSYGHVHNFQDGTAYWQIQDVTDSSFGPVVFKLPFLEEHWDLDEPPEELRREYERLIGYEPGQVKPAPFNLVELIADDDDCAFDQPCAFGYRVEQHAVYCHNQTWLYAPRKCWRGNEAWDGKPHATCPGYQPNPRFVKEAAL